VYIGTEAACALAMHLTKTAAYGAGNLLDTRVVLLGLALAPATLAGAWTGKRIIGWITAFASWIQAARMRVARP
jgi:hypothetical protein